MKRRALPTGIEKLDEMLDGGFREKTINMLNGQAGTGKTILATQMANNFLEQGYVVLFLTYESDDTKVFRRGEMFGWHLTDYAPRQEPANQRFLVQHPQSEEVDIDKVTKYLVEVGKDPRTRGEKGLIIIVDSITKLFEIAESKEKEPGRPARDMKRQDMWRMMFKLGKGLSGTDTTLIFLGEAEDGGERITLDGVAEYECDGVITLYYLLVGNKKERTISIRKMRETGHSDRVHKFEIAPGKGIVVKEAEDAYKV